MSVIISPEKQELLETIDRIEQQYQNMSRTLKRKMPIKSRMAYGCISQEVNNSLRHLHRLRHWIVHENDLENEKGGVF